MTRRALEEAVADVVGRRVMVWRCDRYDDHDPHVVKTDDRWIYECLGELDLQRLAAPDDDDVEL
jgi:hypothetical protein